MLIFDFYQGHMMKNKFLQVHSLIIAAQPKLLTVGGCNCIHRIASGGYYGFRFVMPPPLQCVERFHRYHSNKQNVIASLLKFVGYIHNHKIAGYVPHYKILTGNIFGLILKNKMATTGVSLSVIKSAYISLIIGPRVLGWKTNL